MNKVTANIYEQPGFRGGRGNKVFVTTSEGIVVIDTPLFLTDSVNWCQEISKHGQIRYLIIADQHPDHYQGSYFFPGTVVAHEETRKAMTARTPDMVAGFVKRLDPEALPLLNGYRLKLPDITFTDGMTLHLGHHTFELIPLPGHAPGVIGVYVPEERAVFASDCLFYKSKTFLPEATPADWLASLERLAGLDVDIVIPGHGDPLCNKQYLQEQASIIKSWVETIESAIKKGLTKDEAVASLSCPDPYPLPPYGPMSEADLNKVMIAHLYEVLAH